MSFFVTLKSFVFFFSKCLGYISPFPIYIYIEKDSSLPVACRRLHVSDTVYTSDILLAFERDCFYLLTYFGFNLVSDP